jgi:hypothetical protein
MLRSVLYVFGLLLLASCVTSHKRCPAASVAQTRIVADLMHRYHCTDKYQVEGTVHIISSWSCSDRQITVETLPPDPLTVPPELSPERRDCLLLSRRIANAFAEGAPSAWNCAKALNPDPPSQENPCNGL